MDEELLKILRCPETRQELRLAGAELVERLNQQIASGALKNRGGRQVIDKVNGGLVRSDGEALYPVRQSIPMLLVDEAIPLG